MLLRYVLSFLSKMVYLSLGNISSSRGISEYHRLMDLMLEMPLRSRAALTVSTILSTWRRRLRWRAFWWRERRQGIFLLRAERDG